MDTTETTFKYATYNKSELRLIRDARTERPVRVLWLVVFGVLMLFCCAVMVVPDAWSDPRAWIAIRAHQKDLAFVGVLCTCYFGLLMHRYFRNRAFLLIRKLAEVAGVP